MLYIELDNSGSYDAHPNPLTYSGWSRVAVRVFPLEKVYSTTLDTFREVTPNTSFTSNSSLSKL